jgi:hypothetical protein
MFDRVVVVDWSASSRPVRGRDSIWIGVTEPPFDDVATSNPPTRSEACEVLERWCGRPGRTLLGVDFSLGYPAGTAARLGCVGEPWNAMWDLLDELVVDGDDNRNNRFEVAAELNARLGGSAGPFWGCPPAVRSATLTSTKVDPTPLGEWRITELELRRRGYRPFSTWQLLGAGSVGGQTLLGIARLARLRTALTAAGRSVDVWPFTGANVTDSSANVVIAEVWPSIHPLPDLAGRVRDEVQVAETARRLALRDTIRLPGTLARRALRAVVGEEGWVVGA